MDIFRKLKELNFPLGEYVVCGGAMAAHNISGDNDLDILVKTQLYNKLINEGWVECLCEQCVKTDRIMLKNNDVDILPNFIYGNYSGNTDWLIKNADIIHGYPFINLVELIKFKKELGRPKDLTDIELIKEYIKNSNYINETPLNIL